MRTWTKRDPVKNYFPLPNEIYQLGLSHGAIAVYGYLLRIEDRRTYQCHPSYATIGKAVGMSRNTVRKYVQELEERGLIRTERTSTSTIAGLEGSPATAARRRRAGTEDQRYPLLFFHAVSYSTICFQSPGVTFGM